jgi:hypothetical protein
MRSNLTSRFPIENLVSYFHHFFDQDQNRYNAGRGAHLNLKRAEKARILVNKISGTIKPSNFILY